MDRRAFVTFAGLAGLAAASGAEAQQAVTPAPIVGAGSQGKFLHVYAGPDGKSHIELVDIGHGAALVPLTTMRAVNYQPTEVTWHHVPQKQFVINTTGWLEVELGDGTKHRIGPGDLVFLEDATGTGHVTRLQGEGVTCLFIGVPPDFDVMAWAKGEKA